MLHSIKGTILIRILLLLPFFALSQQENDNVIIVKNVSFDKMFNALLDSGYKIDKSDKEYLTIKTEYKNICENCIPQILFDIRIKDSTAIITGTWRTNAGLKLTANHPETGDMKRAYTYPVKNENMKIARVCFEKMDSFAKSFGLPVTYIKK